MRQSPVLTQHPQAWLAWSAARLGWPGLTGLVLLACGVLLCRFGVQPMLQAAEQLEARVQSQQQAARVAPVHTAPVQDWRSNLPDDKQAYERLAGVFQAAEAAGLALDTGDYRTQLETRSGLGRVVIDLPVTGAYPDVRAFMAQSLNQDAALALERVRLSRESIESAALQADLRFALYLGVRP